MTMYESLFQLINFIIEHNGIGNKSVLIEQVQKRFELTLDRVVYYSEHYKAIKQVVMTNQNLFVKIGKTKDGHKSKIIWGLKEPNP